MGGIAIKSPRELTKRTEEDLALTNLNKTQSRKMPIAGAKTKTHIKNANHCGHPDALDELYKRATTYAIAPNERLNTPEVRYAKTKPSASSAYTHPYDKPLPR